jgi:hypothetical protein
MRVMSAMGSITRRKNELYEMLRQWGWFNLGLFILNKFFVTVSNGNLRLYKYHLIAQPVGQTPLLPPRRGRNIDVGLIDEGEGIIREFPRPATAIQARFAQGARCLVARKEERFIGFLWVLLGGYQEDEVRARYIPLPEGNAAWDFDVYVEPESRFGLAFPRLWDEANRFLREHDVSWSCSRISAFNAGSLGAHARLGTRLLGSAIFFCAGPWQLTLASVSPYFHLSTHSDSFPEFRLNTRGLGNAPPPAKDKTTME